MQDYVFPSPEDAKTSARAGNMVEFINDVSKWATSSHLPAKERDKLLQRLAKCNKAAESITKVSQHPMTLGVFGESQSGKSYLVNELARGDSERLSILIGGATVDFLEEINPAGGRESTSLVTRFSRIEHEVPDADFPIRIGLLSQTDLLKIMVNGFAYECADGQTTVDPAEFQQSLDDLRSRPDAADYLFSIYDLYDVESYIVNELARPYFTSLSELGFWDSFREVILRKSFDVQVEYLSWLWKRNGASTNLYKKLADSMRRLNSEQLWMETSGLAPRNLSILDVENLKRYLRSFEDNTVRVMTPDGRKASLSRSLLCALTGELMLQTPSEKSASFMQFCDILDFPGARSRGASYSAEQLDAAPKTPEDIDFLAEVFLRGKIAYLFDKYLETRDINSLALCIPPDNPSAQSLPQLVSKWIRLTHGSTPADRQNKPVSLYTVFTKFDETLVKKKGDKDPSSPVRWESRLDSGFEKFLGRIGRSSFENWTVKWDLKGPFSNCFWIRNPNVDQAVFDKKGDSETLREGYGQWLEALKPHYLNNPYVKGHFADTEKSWAEVATPSRTGVQYLIESLSVGLNPDQKSVMLNQNLERIFENIDQLTAPFRVDNVSVETSRLEGAQRAKELDEREYEAPVFGQIMQRFLIKEKQVETAYDEAYKRAIVQPAASGPEGYSQQQASPVGSGLRRRGPMRIRKEAPETADSGTGSQQAHRFAELVMKKWEANLATLENDHNLINFSGLSAEWFRSVSDTLVKGTQLKGPFSLSLADEIAQLSAGALRSPDPGSHKKAQAFLVAQLIGNFVGNLGKQRETRVQPNGEPPEIQGEGFPGEHFLKEWLTAIVDLYSSNVAGSIESIQAAEAGSRLQTLMEGYRNKIWS
jgi:hypothetical protein